MLKQLKWLSNYKEILFIVLNKENMKNQSQNDEYRHKENETNKENMKNQRQNDEYRHKENEKK